jgi:hypothetical protein
MNVKIEYQFTRDDYVAILRAARRVGFMGRFWFWVVILMWSILAISILLGFIAYATISDYSFSKVIPDWSEYFPVVVIVTLYTLYIVFRNQLIARFKFSSLPMANKIMSIIVDDFGVHAKAGESEGRTPWSEFRWLIQRSDALCLFTGQRIVFLIPLRAMANTAALAELADAIRAKLPDKIRC